MSVTGCVTGGSRDPVVSDITVSVVAAWVLLNVTWLLLLGVSVVWVLLLGVLFTVDVAVLLGSLHAVLNLRCCFNNSSLSCKVVSGGSPLRRRLSLDGCSIMRLKLSVY